VTAVPLGRIFGNELTGAQEASTGLRLDPVVAAAVGLQRCRTVRADDLKVLEPVVVRDAVDVIQDQRHWASEPFLSLPAQLALAALQALAEQSALQRPAVVVRVGHENLAERPPGAGHRIAPGPIRVKVPGVDAVALDQLPERPEIPPGRAEADGPESLGQATRGRDRVPHLLLGVENMPRHTRTLVRASDGITLFAGNSYLRALFPRELTSAGC
jgi:hypothetical protein